MTRIAKYTQKNRSVEGGFGVSIGMAMILGLTVSFMTLGIDKARAGDPIKDVPALMRLAAYDAYTPTPLETYPALFGTEERSSTNLEPFTKWTGMFERFEADFHNEQSRTALRRWQEDLSTFQGLEPLAMAQKVNDLINTQKYIIDSKNWGKSDYWATPVEFFARGGDCEDFAIAKYTALRALGVSEERLRVVILHDEQKNMPHAVLVYYTDDGAVMLDNQVKDVRFTADVTRYRPIFSINRHAWWLHTKPTATIIASAE